MVMVVTSVGVRFTGSQVGAALEGGRIGILLDLEFLSSRQSLVDLHRLDGGGKRCVVNAEMEESKRGVTYVSNGPGLGPRISTTKLSARNTCMN
jgi:hypothetical protein